MISSANDSLCLKLTLSSNNHSVLLCCTSFLLVPTKWRKPKAEISPTMPFGFLYISTVISMILKVRLISKPLEAALIQTHVSNKRPVTEKDRNISTHMLKMCSWMCLWLFICMFMYVTVYIVCFVNVYCRAWQKLCANCWLKCRNLLKSRTKVRQNIQIDKELVCDEEQTCSGLLEVVLIWEAQQ